MTKSEKIIRRGILVNAMKKSGYRLNKEAKGCCENCPFKPVIADECVHTYIDEIWCEQERKVEANMIPNGKEMTWNGHHLVFESEPDPCRGCFFADKDECPDCDEGAWVEDNTEATE